MSLLMEMDKTDLVLNYMELEESLKLAKTDHALEVRSLNLEIMLLKRRYEKHLEQAK